MKTPCSRSTATASGSTARNAAQVERECQAIRDEVRQSRERAERLRHQARRADLKLAQLATLTPEGFEEFVAELFEALGYEVEQVGGTGDEGADLRVRRDSLLAIVQCKYHRQGVVGSPELQKFLGTIHHTRSHKGFFVTTRTFSLAAEKFVGRAPDRADRRPAPGRTRPGSPRPRRPPRAGTGLVLTPAGTPPTPALEHRKFRDQTKIKADSAGFHPTIEDVTGAAIA